MADRSCWEDFEVQRELGRGTWGTVLLARRQQDGNMYALKVVQLEKRSQRDQMAAVQECQMLASLSSPHITRYYDSFLHQGTLVIVMELAPGGSLHAAIGRSPRPLPEDVIWRVLLHIALALHHMHSRRMLHRDVKSLNVFLTGPLDGQGRHTQFKLGDVGVSKVLDEGKNHASTLIGTPYYLSPEICQEKPYDAKSDIWALGVVLYECATRRHPFDAQSQPSLIMKILRGRYEPVVGLSPDLTAIINRCLSQAAARRPSAERLLSLPAVRAKAAEFGMELPPSVLAAAPAAVMPPTSGGCGGGDAKKGALPSLKAVMDASLAARLDVVPGRRATCPHGPTPSPAASPAPPRAQVVGRRSTPHGGCEDRRVPLGPPVRLKPPLPAAAVPRRRQTEQHPPQPKMLSSLQGAPAPRRQVLAGAPLSPPPAPAPLQPAAPLQAGAAAVMAAGLAAQPPQQAGAAAPLYSAPRQAQDGGPGGAQLPSPRRHSHFSVTKHLRAVSSAAQQWLALRGGATDGSDADSLGREGSGNSKAGLSAAASQVDTPAAADTAVERSTKSDSSLLIPANRSAELADDGDGQAGTPSVQASLASDEAEDQADMRQALKQRCVALLGSEALFDELYGLAEASVDGPNVSRCASSSEAGPAPAASPTPRLPTLAALGDVLFARVGYTGHAAEALHLLMRLLAME